MATFFNPATFWQSWNAFICVFLFILGIFIVLIHHCGGAFAYERFIKKRLHHRKQVELSSLLLSKCLVIDDYFSSLTVGSVMHPITDGYKIPRAKLAFLVDAMAAPLTILCPVSSWVAAIVGFLRENGMHHQLMAETRIVGSPFVAYINIIPYILYSFMIIISAWTIVLKGFSFGLMGKHEACALATGNVFNGKTAPKKNFGDIPAANREQASMFDFFIPVGFLVISVLAGILFSGGYYLLGGGKPLVAALRDASAAQGLFLGGSNALFLTTLFFLGRGKLKLRSMPILIKQGCMLMGTSCAILILAWTLGGILRNELATGQYLASLMIGKLPSELVPMMFFIASIITAFAIGSAWGTAAVMFPIGIQLILTMHGATGPVAMEEIKLLFPTLGAILSGCVAGDHISPISDTTIMSSTSTAMDHTDHVETQMTYAIPIIFVTAFAYLNLGYLITSWNHFAAIGVTLLLAGGSIFYIFKFLARKSLFEEQSDNSQQPIVSSPSACD